MSMPNYVAPEQAMTDRADFARKGIAKGRALVALRYEHGIVLVAENTSQSLRKVSEIYDRIAFAGVGKYNEFDQLRVAGIRSAELTGYQYSRDDVDARGLANDYAQLLGNAFTHGMKPMEVEILVAEVGVEGSHDDQIFHIMYDGTVIDRPDTCALGGESDAISNRLSNGFAEGFSLVDAIRLGVSSLSGDGRSISADSLEIAILERNGDRRCFRRLEASEVEAALQE